MPDVFTPQMFGARGDGETDDSPAFQAALRAANGSGSELTFQGSGKVFVPKPERFYRLASTWDFDGVENVVAEGSAGAEGREFIRYDGRGDAALSLVGANRVTLRDLSIRAVNSSQCVILLGRSDGARSFGAHLLDRVTAYGAVTVAALCIFASEENAFRNCRFEVQGGPARWTVLIGQTPPPGVRFARVQDSTCLCNWFSNCRIISPGPGTRDSAAVFVRVRGGVGDLVFRDSFVGLANGVAFHFDCVRETQIPFGLVLQHIRAELATGSAPQAGVRFRNAGGGEVLLDGVTVEGLNFPHLGDRARLVDGGDGVTFRGARFVQNFAVAAPSGLTNSSIHRGVGIVVEEPFTARFEVRDADRPEPPWLVNGRPTARVELTVPPWDASAVNGGTSFRDVSVAAARVGDLVTVAPQNVIAAPELAYHGRVIADGTVRVVMTNHGARPHSGPDRLVVEVTRVNVGAG